MCIHNASRISIPVTTNTSLTLPNTHFLAPCLEIPGTSPLWHPPVAAGHVSQPPRPPPPPSRRCDRHPSSLHGLEPYGDEKYDSLLIFVNYKCSYTEHLHPECIPSPPQAPASTETANIWACSRCGGDVQTLQHSTNVKSADGWED